MYVYIYNIYVIYIYICITVICKILKHLYKLAEFTITQIYRNISNLKVFIHRKRLKMTNSNENHTLK